MDGVDADELDQNVADRSKKVAEATPAAIENAKRFGAVFDSTVLRISKSFQWWKDVSIRPNGHALKQASSPVGGVLT